MRARRKPATPDHQHQRRPARDQIAVARVPQFARSEQRIARADRRNQADALLQRLREAIKLERDDPQRRAYRQPDQADAPAFEAPRAAPHEAIGGAQQGVGGANPPDVGDGRRLPGEQRGAGRADQISDAPQRQRRRVAVLQKGEQQQQAADNGDEQRHRKQGRHVEDDMGNHDRRHCVPNTPVRGRIHALIAAQSCGRIAGLPKIRIDS
jgi:hypothetical protein